MTWTPKGWWTPTAVVPLASFFDACQCERCTADGQHNLLCEVHQDPPKACDCARSDTPAKPAPVGAS